MPLPIGTAALPVAMLSAPGQQNPQPPGTQPGRYQQDALRPAKPVEYFTMFGVTDADKQMLQDTVTQVRTGWQVDRMARFRVWMLNIAFEKSMQWVAWDSEGNQWYDVLSYARENGGLSPGESADYEQYTNGITLMFKQVFVNNLAQAIPRTVVRPADASNRKDVQTSKASTDVLEILDRRNHKAKLTRQKFGTLYTFGSFFTHTRAVLDGVENGYDEESVFADLQVAMPARMKCMGCAAETPIAALDPQEGRLTECPECGAPMGQESFYGAGEGDYTGLQVASTQRVPRAGVKQTVHSPLEVDLSPIVAVWHASPLLSKLQDIYTSEALRMFPAFRDRMQQATGDPTNPNSEMERIQRMQVRSATTGYGADIALATQTYGQHWLQPSGYNQLNDQDFVDRMDQMFPEGLLLTMVGSVVVDIRPASLRREWSSARLFDDYGPYSMSLAERVVPFNQRFNAAMQVLDNWMQRAPAGLNVMRASMLSKDKVTQQGLRPAQVFEVADSGVGGQPMPLSEIFMHYDLPLDAAAWNYPQMILTFCGMIACLPPQAGGQGTPEEVATMGGQQMQLNQAQQSMRMFWENVKDESADAAQNQIYWVKKLMDAGALQELVEVEEERGAGWRNTMVDWQSMGGDVNCWPDQDQGLPTSPDELRKSILMMFEALTQGNSAAAMWFAIPENAEMAISMMLPGTATPNEEQVTRTEIAIQMLVNQPPQPKMQPDGRITMELPATPSLRVDDVTVAKDVVQRFMLKQCDLEYTKPEAWENLTNYMAALDNLKTQYDMVQASNKLKVQQAGAPKPPGPDPTTQQQIQMAIQHMTTAAERLQQLMMLDPSVTKNTANAQVSAANDLFQRSGDAAELITKGKQ